MATQATVSLEDYLKMSWEHDREYVDGEIIERGMPTHFHGWVQGRFGYLFNQLAERFAVNVASEVRNRVAERRIRIPDVALYKGSHPEQDVPDAPPIVAIEILSPDDRRSEVLAKFREYRAWGVRHIWLIDPKSREMSVFGEDGLCGVTEFALPEFGVTYTARDIFGK